MCRLEKNVSFITLAILWAAYPLLATSYVQSQDARVAEDISGLRQSRQQLHHIAGAVAVVELGFDNLVPAGLAGTRGAGQAEDEGAVGDTAQCP